MTTTITISGLITIAAVMTPISIMTWRATTHARLTRRQMTVEVLLYVGLIGGYVAATTTEVPSTGLPWIRGLGIIGLLGAGLAVFRTTARQGEATSRERNDEGRNRPGRERAESASMTRRQRLAVHELQQQIDNERTRAECPCVRALLVILSDGLAKIAATEDDPAPRQAAKCGGSARGGVTH